jgi:hypothetical protein
MSGNEQNAVNQAAAGNIGNWQGLMDQANGAMGGALGQIGAAGTNFDNAGNYIGYGSQGFDAANNYLAGATGNFDSAGNTIGSATGNYNTATGNVNAAGSNFNTSDNLYGQAGTSYGNASGALGNAAGVINNGTGILNNANPALANAGSTLDWATGNLNPAFNQTTQGGSTLYGDSNNQRMLDAYLNPYRTQVSDEIARMGNQNLTDNVIPQLNSTFVGDGQFGSTRNAGFMNNALRDNQQTITGAQSQVLLAAMNEAQKNYGLEKDRQLQSGRDLGALSQIGGQLGSQYIDQATGYINAANANTNIGNSLNQNAGLQTDLGRAQTDTGLASTTTGNARVNQGLANKSIGDSVVNQGSAMTQLGNARVNQGQAATQLGTARVNQGLAATQLGNARVNQGQASGQIGFNQGQLGQMRNAAGINDINALLGTGGMQRGIDQAQLDSNLALWQDWRDHPLNSLGALSQVLPNVSGRITPDSVQSTGYTAAQPDVYKNLQEIIAAINGRS